MDPKEKDDNKNPWKEMVEPVPVGVAHLPTKLLSKSVGSKHIMAKINNCHNKA
jgi:hypothetical protein